MSDIRVVEFKKKPVDDSAQRNHEAVIEMLERMLAEAKEDPSYTVFAVCASDDTYSYDIAGNELVSTMIGLTHFSLNKLIAHKIAHE